MRGSIRMGRKVAMTSVFLFFALALVTSPAWAQTGTVSGTVTNADGDPLPGAHVSLQNEDGSSAGLSTTSDANGAFRIPGVAAGSYTVTANLAGFQLANQAIEMTADGEVAVDFAMSPAFHDAVIVSAQRVEEDILDVPMTITAFDTRMMERLQIQNKVDLQDMTPGLQFGDEVEQAGQGTVIRGIGTRQAMYEEMDYAVATYIDGAYTLGVYGSAPGGGFDLERVEVARGPQGTLHGRNSIAGSINLVNTRPTQRWDATLMGEANDWNQYRFNAAVGGPLGGAFSFRLTGGTHTGDGIQENVGPGGDHDAPDQTFWAPQLRVQTSRFDMNMRYSHVEDTGTPNILVQLSNPNTTDEYIGWEANPYYGWEGSPAVDPDCPVGVPGWHCGGIENKVALNYPGYQDGEAEYATLYANYQITDNVAARYSFGYSDVLSYSVRDVDLTDLEGTPDNPSFDSESGTYIGGMNDYYELPFDYDEMSHELTFSSSYPGSFNFITGLFYYENDRGGGITRYSQSFPWGSGNADELARATSPIYGWVPVESCQDVLEYVVGPDGWNFGSIDPENPALGLYWYCPEGTDHSAWVDFFARSTSETQAAFFSGNYQFNQHWTLSGGLRYTEDTKDQPIEDQGGFYVYGMDSEPWPGGKPGVPLVIGFSQGEGFGGSGTWSHPIGHLALEYRTSSGNLVYGRISNGFRAGGFNITDVPGSVPPFIKEETLINYELGGKGLFFNSRLQITTGLWYNDFQDYQLAATQAAPPGTTIPVPSWNESPFYEYIANIPDTKIWGLDFEFSWYPTNHFSLMGFYAWQDSEIGPHQSVVWGDPDAEFAPYTYFDFFTGEQIDTEYQLETDQTGNRLPMQPEHKLALTAGYNIPLGRSGGDLQLLATYSYTDEQYIDIANLSFSEIPAYDRWDASVGWTAPGGKWSLVLFGKNLADEVGIVEMFPGFDGGMFEGYLTYPRQVGLQLYWRPFN